MFRLRSTRSLSFSAQARRYGQTYAQKLSRFLTEPTAADLHQQGRDPEADDASHREIASAHLAKLAAMLG